MLSDHTRELLTAYLDGELPGRERTAVMQLLQRSSQARAILQQLQEGAKELRQLPTKKLPADFSAQVMTAIAERGLQPGKGAPPPVRPRVWAWPARLAIAATVLLALSLGGYALYTRVIATMDNPPVANVNPPSTPSPLVDVRIPVAEYQDEQAKERLTAELKKEAPSSVRLDLAVTNASKAVARVEEAFKVAKVKVVKDASTKASLEKDEPNKSYVLYVENVRPEEVAGILQQLADQSKGAAIQTAFLHPLSAQERDDLSKFVGVQAVRPDQLPMIIPGTPDPLEPKTKNQQQPSAQTEPDRLAFVLPYTEGAGGLSRNVQDFLSSRPGRQPGTVQFIVVIQEASA